MPLIVICVQSQALTLYFLWSERLAQGETAVSRQAWGRLPLSGRQTVLACIGGQDQQLCCAKTGVVCLTLAGNASLPAIRYNVPMSPRLRRNAAARHRKATPYRLRLYFGRRNLGGEERALSRP